jgi:hypothetical protein
MFIIAGILGGAALGAYRAKKRGGKLADMVQYGAAHAMAFGILGLIVTIIIERSIA